MFELLSGLLSFLSGWLLRLGFVWTQRTHWIRYRNIVSNSKQLIKARHWSASAQFGSGAFCLAKSASAPPASCCTQCNELIHTAPWLFIASQQRRPPVRTAADAAANIPTLIRWFAPIVIWQQNRAAQHNSTRHTELQVSPRGGRGLGTGPTQKQLSPTRAKRGLFNLNWLMRLRKCFSRIA